MTVGGGRVRFLLEGERTQAWIPVRDSRSRYALPQRLIGETTVRRTLRQPWTVVRLGVTVRAR
jgi:hypothetical protein